MAVYLGFQDQLVLPTHENAIGWFTDKMGGLPNWMYGGEGVPCCTECRSCLFLVTQLCCQVDAAFHRVLYIFTCLHNACRGKPHCWKVFRSQMKVADQAASIENNAETKVNEHARPSDWCEGADDWGEEEEPVAMETINHYNDNSLNISKTTFKEVETGNSASVMNTTEIASQLNALNITVEEVTEDVLLKASESCAPKKPQVTDSSEDLAAPSKNTIDISGKLDHDSNKSQPFTSYFVSTIAESETLQVTADEHVLKLLKDYERREGSSYRDDFMEDSGGSRETYEKAEIKHGDKTLYKFKKCLQDNPEQCIRYQWGGNPLLISDVTGSTFSSSIPPCPHCGEQRVFECQLMPALADVLKLESDTESVLEFGTILVFCCQASCWGREENLREEAVFLMHYPDHALFNT